MTWLRSRLRDGERGSALVEFVFVALVVFVPLIYVVAGFSAVQRGVFASTAAAREAGRAIATAPDPVIGQERGHRTGALHHHERQAGAIHLLPRGAHQALGGLRRRRPCDHLQGPRGAGG